MPWLFLAHKTLAIKDHGWGMAVSCLFTEIFSHPNSATRGHLAHWERISGFFH
jgi:hypothetical protein